MRKSDNDVIILGLAKHIGLYLNGNACSDGLKLWVWLILIEMQFWCCTIIQVTPSKLIIYMNTNS